MLRSGSAISITLTEVSWSGTSRGRTLRLMPLLLDRSQVDDAKTILKAAIEFNFLMNIIPLIGAV